MQDRDLLVHVTQYEAVMFVLRWINMITVLKMEPITFENCKQFKHESLSLEGKVNVIDKCDSSWAKVKVVDHYGISKQAVLDILKGEDKSSPW